MYLFLKHFHVATALVTATLFLLRLGLDWANRPWRHTPLRILPHVNDTLLLASAVGMLVIAGGHLLTQGWLIAKVILLLAYIGAGKLALDQHRGSGGRLLAVVVALALLGSIFAHAVYKPY